MKLEKQFLDNHGKSGGIGMSEKQSIGCVEIAENFAIDFAEWVIDAENKPIGEFTIQQLLEIYKEKL